MFMTIIIIAIFIMVIIIYHYYSYCIYEKTKAKKDYITSMD